MGPQYKFEMEDLCWKQLASKKRKPKSKVPKSYTGTADRKHCAVMKKIGHKLRDHRDSLQLRKLYGGFVNTGIFQLRCHFFNPGVIFTLPKKEKGLLEQLQKDWQERVGTTGTSIFLVPKEPTQPSKVLQRCWWNQWKLYQIILSQRTRPFFHMMV